MQCVVYRIGISCFYIPARKGFEQAVPGSTSPRSPLADLDCGNRSITEDTEGGRVERAWHGRAAAEGPVALRRAGASRGILKPRYFKDPKRHEVKKRIMT